MDGSESLYGSTTRYDDFGRNEDEMSGVTEQFADKFAPPPNADNLNAEICKCYYTLSRKCLTTTTTMLNSRMEKRMERGGDSWNFKP